MNDPQILEHVEQLDGFVESVANVDIDLMEQSIEYIERMEDEDQPWFLYHSKRS